MTRRTPAILAAAVFMVFGTTACATKKYVNQTVNPVEARVTATEKKVADHSSAITDLENNLSRADEKATEAGRNAAAANDAAKAANEAALTAQKRADAANSLGEQNAGKIGSVEQRTDQRFSNLDNYQLVSTEAVLFPLGKSTLTRDAKGQLDQIVDQLKTNKNYVVEVRGFTDKTGSAQSNLVLSQKRADEVVRYLTTQHEVPLRKIHVLGAGVDTQDEQTTRAARQQARKVEMKVYALNLENKTAQGQAATMDSAGQTRSRVEAPAKIQ